MENVSASGQAVGEVVGLEGQARAVAADQARDLELGSPVYQGETLVTSGDSHIEVRFVDDTRLAQGENSSIKVDQYVHDSEEPTNSNLLLEMGKGVFRTVTGEIAEQNPDNFKIKSPMALIGIRGTTVLSEVKEGFETHGAEEIGAGKMLVIQDNFGNIQFISHPEMVIDVYANQPIQKPRPLTSEEFEYFQNNTPISGETSEKSDQSGQEGGEKIADSGEEVPEETSEDDKSADMQESSDVVDASVQADSEIIETASPEQPKVISTPPEKYQEEEAQGGDQEKFVSEGHFGEDELDLLCLRVIDFLSLYFNNPAYPAIPRV